MLDDDTPAAGGAPTLAAMSELSLLHDIDALLGQPQPTGIGELDRVLDGGIVPGSVTLLGGEPGIGKSTLLLQLVAWWPGTTLYVSAEESPQQVRLRAERLGAVRPELWIAAESSLERRPRGDRPHRARPRGDRQHPDHRRRARLASAPGSIGQVRDCAQQLVVEAKRRGVAMVLVGHVTKDGSLAGPRVLEHVVDTVLSFEGERHHALRMLRAVKHRFGSTNELGLFEMTGHGLVGVPDPSKLFLSDRRRGLTGSVVVPVIEGHRPVLVEIQALTVPIPSGTPPRRNAQGLDGGRLALLLAVLERHALVRLGGHDVYVSAVGGMRLTEPGTDLGVAVAVAAAAADLVVPDDLVVVGEVGLGGEVRQVARAAAPTRRGVPARVSPGDRAGVVAAGRRHPPHPRRHAGRGAGPGVRAGGRLGSPNRDS